MLPQSGGKSTHQNKSVFQNARVFHKIPTPAKEKLLVLLRTRCEQYWWMGRKTTKDRASQKCPGWQRSREPGQFQSTDLSVLMTGQPWAHSPWAEHLHPGSHQRALTARDTSKGQSLETNSVWNKHSHPSPPQKKATMVYTEVQPGRSLQGDKMLLLITHLRPGVSRASWESEGEDLIIHPSPNGRVPSHLQSNQELMRC